MTPPTAEMISQTIRAFLSSPDWQSAKDTLKAQQDVLLHPATEVGFEQIIAMQSDPKLIQAMIQHLNLLRLSRRMGIDAAFENPGQGMVAPSSEALAIVIGGFVRTEECEDTLAYLYQNQRLLLHPAADAVFETLIEQADNDDTAQLLKSHYTMVQSCREYGIEAGFNRVKDSVWPDSPEPVPYEDIMHAVVSYVNTPDWASAQAVVESNQGLLLGLAADIVFAQIIASQQQKASVEKLHMYRKVLAWAREIGIEAAFERAEREFPSGPPLQAIADAIARFANTGSWPEARQAFDAHQHLLMHPAAPQVFEQLMTIVRERSQHDMLEALQDHLLVCQWVQEFGVEEAFRRAAAEL